MPMGTDLLSAARAAQVEIEAPCGGKGSCGKCLVRILSGEADSDSLGVLPAMMVTDGYVLACKTRVMQTSLVVEVPEPSNRQDGQFSEEDETYLVRTELLPKEWEFDPLGIKWVIQVPPPQTEDGLSDLDRLIRATQQQWGKREVICELDVIRSLAKALRMQGGQVTATIIREDDRLHITQIQPGDKTTDHHGIAVDIGTTTVAVQLIDLITGKILVTHSAYNDQIACGLDVISRINYARRPERLAELRKRVLNTVNDLIQQAARSRSVNAWEISNAVVSGNTTMIHLLLGLPPEYIRLEPYTPTLLEVPYLTAEKVGLAINPNSWVCFSPNVGSYVGGDITAGLLCSDLATDSEEISLFIDIGTNGELVIGNRDFLLSCACSAGPAFEGGGIDCGMRAAAGAIEKVEISRETGKAAYATIGNTPPKGICGSGMIDLLANLYLTGWIDQAGKLDRVRHCPSIVVEGRTARYVIASAEESATGREVAISELDIENVIRAKAAIYSACSLMMDQVGIGFEELSHIYIAGGFGRFLGLEKAVVLGLLPDIPRDKFQFIGNASLMGSYMVVVSQEYRQKQLALARRMTYFDLSNAPGYMDQYTGALFLPHTDLSRFPSVKVLKSGVNP